MPAGTRLEYLHGGFTGTLLAYTRSGDPIVWWDTHFGSPVQDAPASLIREFVDEDRSFSGKVRYPVER